ncbi:MAG: hypothetical protein EA381_21070 [Planctomycetaceae bacterium]|nr:MAG: hypothetical protein EA381_21070 [Planctomycetaceae bacterium]
MWDICEPGLAEFRANGWKLVVVSEPSERRSRPAENAGVVDPGPNPTGWVRLLSCRDGLVGASARIRLPDVELPPLSEVFVRGDEIHFLFPATATCPIGMELVLLGIEADENHLLVESTISINTSLLDSSPQVELRVGGGHPGKPNWDNTPWSVLANLADVHWWAASSRQPGLGPAVMTQLCCDRRDLHSLDQRGSATDRGLCFFGDFLEKGVIRRIRPWWLWSNQRVARDVAERVSLALRDRPLPLGS